MEGEIGRRVGKRGVEGREGEGGGNRVEVKKRHRRVAGGRREDGRKVGKREGKGKGKRKEMMMI